MKQNINVKYMTITINLQEVLPDGFHVRDFGDRGWGIGYIGSFKVGDVIYEYPITQMPSEDIKFVSTPSIGPNKVPSVTGEMNFDKTRMSSYAQEHNTFTGFDGLVMDTPDDPLGKYDFTFHKRDGKLYGRLICIRDHPGPCVDITCIGPDIEESVAPSEFRVIEDGVTTQYMHEEQTELIPPYS